MGAFAGVKTTRTEATGSRQSQYWTAVCGILIAAIVLCGAVDAVFDRTFSNNLADGAMYLDISRAFADGSPTALLNTYWSPGYPVALAAGLEFLKPSPALELAAVYAINWAIGQLALGCFIYFVTGLSDARKAAGAFGLTRPMLLAAGCALFLIAVQSDAPVALITPDLLLSAWLWLGGGAFLRIARRQRAMHYAVLAVALSLAYFTKVVALPLALVALVMLPFTGRNRKRAAGGIVVYAAIVVLLISPYVAKLSASKGRFTFGESGGLNYAWIVDGAERWELQNDSPRGHATLHLIHPARMLLKAPPVFEFASPVEGSFPIFNDPSYWDDGLKPMFYLKGELWHIAMNLYHTLSWLGRRGEFVFALVLLFFLQRRAGMPSGIRRILPVFLWFLAMWGLYLVVDVEDRYVFAALTSLLVLVAAAIRLPDSVRMRRMVAVCILILVCGAALRAFDAAGEKVFKGVKLQVIGVGPDKLKGFGPYESPYWKVARTITARLGLHPDDSVACMQMGCDNVYWARLAGVRVIADVTREADYWAAGPEDRARVMETLSRAGVKALVARHLGRGAESEGWVPLGEELYARPVKPAGSSQ